MVVVPHIGGDGRIPGRAQLGNETRSRQVPAKTRADGERGVFKRPHQATEPVRLGQGVGVGEDQDFGGFGNVRQSGKRVVHLFSSYFRGLGNDGADGEQTGAEYFSIFFQKFFHETEGRVLAVGDGDEQTVSRIILGQETRKMLFEIRRHSFGGQNHGHLRRVGGGARRTAAARVAVKANAAGQRDETLKQEETGQDDEENGQACTSK